MSSIDDKLKQANDNVPKVYAAGVKGGGATNLQNGESTGSLKSVLALDAVSEGAVALGTDTTAGLKCFNITAFDDANKTYTLDSVEGLEVGDVFSLEMGKDYNNVGQITAITDTKVTVDAYQGNDGGMHTLFRIPSKPTTGTVYCGENTFAAGNGTLAKGENAVALGLGTQANGDNSVAEGEGSIASGRNSKASGLNTQAISKGAVALGDGCIAGSKCFNILAFDDTNKSYTLDSVEGLEVGDVYSLKLYFNYDEIGTITKIDGNVVTVSDYYNDEYESDVHYFRVPLKPECGTTDFGVAAFAGGIDSKSPGDCSFSYGRNNRAHGRYGVSFGYDNESGYAAFSGGRAVKAKAQHSFGYGFQILIKQIAEKSVAFGKGLICSSPYQFIFGKFNKEDADNKYSVIIGNGTKDTNRSNSYTLDNEGNVWCAGDIESAKFGKLSDKVSNKEVANALKNTKNGTSIMIDDISPLMHDIDTIVSMPNVLSYPYKEKTKTQNGLTFTDNGDGSITVNGTATAATTFILDANTSFAREGTFVISGCPMSVDKQFNINVTVYKGNINIKQLHDYGDGSPAFSIDGLEYDSYNIKIWFSQGAIANNLVFRPKLCISPTTITLTVKDENDEAQATYIPNADGTVSGVKSVYPVTKLEASDTSAEITTEYNVDTNSALDNIKSDLSDKADAINEYDGFNAGKDSSAQDGGAIGNWATTRYGGAIGSYSESVYGGAVGGSAKSSNGGSVGNGSQSADGGAIGLGAITSDGFAGGKEAEAVKGGNGTDQNDGIDAIQLGKGRNTAPKTLQIYDYQLMDADGNIPVGRLTNAPKTEVVDNLTSTDTDKALSANQGKMLKSLAFNDVIELEYNTSNPWSCDKMNDLAADSDFPLNSLYEHGTYKLQNRLEITYPFQSTQFNEAILVVSYAYENLNRYISQTIICPNGLTMRRLADIYSDGTIGGWGKFKAVTLSGLIDGRAENSVQTRANRYSAVSPDSVSIGAAFAGITGFKLSSQGVDVENKTYELDTDANISYFVGYTFSLCDTNNINHPNYGKITAVDNDTKKITVNNILPYKLNDVTRIIIHPSGSVSWYVDGPNTIGECQVAHGEYTYAYGTYSHAEGSNTHAYADRSHAEGYATQTNGYGSHSEGYRTQTNGSYSHAEGSETTATGIASHSEGYYGTASGQYSHVEGQQNVASGIGSHAEGRNVTAAGDYQHVQGRYAVKDTENKYAHIVGNGTGTDKRSNAHTIDWDGNAYFAGSVEATSIILKSSTEGSSKRFKITVDDSGTLSATEIE